MRAVDANVLVRFLTRDLPDEYRRAAAALNRGDIAVSLTVVLETEWVLRSVYKHDRTLIARSLRGVAGLPGVRVERPDQLVRALSWHEAGMDFADALHLAGAGDVEAFLTFDRRMARAADGLPGAPAVREP